MSQLTKKAIAASFLRLSETMPFEKITVRDIVEECGINRNTFYYYYRDIYDLAQEVFSTGAGFTGTEPLSFSDAVLRFSSYARDHRRAVTGVYHSVDRMAAIQFIGTLVGKPLLARAESINPDVTGSEQKEAVRFVLYGLCGLVFDWLDTGMKTTPEALAARCDILSRRALEGILRP